MNNDIFFNVKEVLDKDKLINMVYGARGIGKTYSSLKYAYNHYKDTGRTTLYLRRYKSELKGKFETILSPLIANKDIDIKKITYDNKNGYRYIDLDNKKVFLEAIPLSKAVTYKSASYNTCDLVIFDEFILDKSSLHYIQNEFELFNNFIETISRLGELTENRVVKVLMLANSSSRNNPYFIGYNIPVYKGNSFTRGDLYIYKPDAIDFKKEKEKTRWGRFILQNTKMSDYMMDGNFNDKTDFLAPLPAKTQYIATLIYLGAKIGVYSDMTDNKIYVSDKYNDNHKITYALTNEDNTPNALILTKDNQLFITLKKYWYYGRLRFTDLKIQSIFIDILQIL